jgi:hypothetical protein
VIDNVYIEYCVDGYNLIKRKLTDLSAQLNEIRREVDDIFNAPFCVDVVIDGIGRMSIGLVDETILCYKSDDLDVQLSAVGNIGAEGETLFYFGDYSLMSNKYLLPYDFCLKIINEWMRNCKLPKINWTKEIF